MASFRLIKEKAKKENGFTVVELVIASLIIAILSLMVVANFRGNTQKTALDNEAERLGGVFRQAHINSLTGKIVQGIRPVGGFGLHLTECVDQCSYILFADDGDYIYDGGVSDIVLQEMNMLEDNVYVNTLMPEDDLDIVFVPPSGDIYINGDTDDDEVSVILGFQNTNYQKTVSINRRSGRINIQ